MDEYKRGRGQAKPPWCSVLGSTCHNASSPHTVQLSHILCSTVQYSTVQYTVRSPGLKHGPTNTYFVFTYLQFDILLTDAQTERNRKGAVEGRRQQQDRGEC